MGAEAANSAVARVTLLVDQAQEVPIALVRRLRERGGTAFIARSAPAAMAEIARHGCQAFVAVDPSALRRLDALLRALRTAYPTVACWRYESSGHGHGRLERLTPAAASEQPQPPTPPRVKAVKPEHEEIAPLLSAEELAMLMGPLDQWDEPRSGGQSR